MAFLRVGLSLDEGDAMPWEDVWSVLWVEVRTPGSPLDRALRPSEHVWTPEMMMLREIEFWTRTLPHRLSSQRGAQEPERIPLTASEPGKVGAGGVAYDIEDMDKMLNRGRPGVEPGQAIDIEDMDRLLGRS